MIAQAIDSLALLRSRLATDSVYRELLENTNEHLSYAWVPVSAAIGLLGVLFAAGAIVAAYALFRQSREHKAMIQEAIDRFERSLGALAAEKDKQITTAIADVTLAKARLEAAAGEVRATADAQIAETLTQLQQRLEQALEQPRVIDGGSASSWLRADNPGLPSRGPFGPRVTGTPAKVQMQHIRATCPKCSLGVDVDRPIGTLMPQVIVCPKCSAPIQTGELKIEIV